MVNCPKCKEEISFLHEYRETKYAFSLNIGGKGDSEPIEDVEDSDTYECPECCEVLFTNIEEAEQFLKGEEVEE